MAFKTKEAARAYQKKWRSANRDKLQSSRDRRKEKARLTNRRWQDDFVKSNGYHRVTLRNRILTEERKLLLFVLLGDKCDGCPWGITDSRLLTVDHVNGGGRQSLLRKSGRGPVMTAVKYKRYLEQYHKDPTSLRLKCFNCHALISHEFFQSLRKAPVCHATQKDQKARTAAQETSLPG